MALGVRRPRRTRRDAGQRPRRPQPVRGERRGRQRGYGGGPAAGLRRRRDGLVRDARRSRPPAAAPRLAASPTPLSRSATGLTWAVVADPRRVARAARHRRRAWAVGEHVRVHGRVLVLDGRRATRSSRAGATPIRSIGFIPTGIALALLLYASSLPSEIEPLVPALQNAPLLTIHVGMAVISYGIFATSFAAGVGVSHPGTARSIRLAALAQGRSTRSPTGRSSSASRSSPR